VAAYGSDRARFGDPDGGAGGEINARRRAWSVMPMLAAVSRSRAPGSWAMHSRTRAWLVRKLQLSIVKD
jgi:hypothetical protein